MAQDERRGFEMLDAFSVHAEGLEAFRTFSNNCQVLIGSPAEESITSPSKGLMYFLNSRAATSG